MSYVVLARKWRPMRFEDLTGQEHVCRTLANAIASGRVAHAILFTGVRGVGKTTAARILAKALNCSAGDGPTASPCLECAPCTEIAAGSDVDVREIDAASYTGVDDVRKLQDSLPYRPARDRFKIFIVDEVHMLSQNAWNAFLKTLEEPPPHVKFIFATTEVHKVPVTILSRVQRFDFKLIPTRLIADRLKHVLREESVDAEDGALSVIAREAAGSMRDAMSLLDQVIAWNDQKLEEVAVARVLGVASRQALQEIGQALVGGNAERCLGLVTDLANQGYDIATLARDLLSLLRDLVVAKVCDDPAPLLDLADDERSEVLALARDSDADDLLRLHLGFSQAFDQVARSGQPRAALEMLLVRLARRPPLLPVDDLIERLRALEARLGASPATRGSGGGAPRGGGAQRGGARPGGQGAPRRAGARQRAAQKDPPRDVAPTNRPEVAEGGPPAVSTQALPTPVAEGDGALDRWRQIVAVVSETEPELAAFLGHAVPLEVSSERITLAFERGTVFEREATTRESIEAIAVAAEARLGQRPQVTFEERRSGEMAETISVVADRQRRQERREAISQAEKHPLIAQARDILGARLKEIRLPDD